MRHDKTRAHLMTLIAVASIVFLVTLFINTLKPVNEQTIKPTINGGDDITESQAGEQPAQAQKEGSVYTMENTNGP